MDICCFATLHHFLSWSLYLTFPLGCTPSPLSKPSSEGGHLTLGLFSYGD